MIDHAKLPSLKDKILSNVNLDEAEGETKSRLEVREKRSTLKVKSKKRK